MPGKITIRKQPRARGRHRPGHMNKTEQAYAAILEERQRSGDIELYKFEAIKFRLADKTFYTPDFLVMLPDGMIEMHEVKGGWIEDDAAVKIKVAAEEFPFVFKLCVKKNKKTPWNIREV